LFAALDWLPTFVDIAGGPKGDGLKKEIEAGKYPGIVKTTLDGFDQRDYLEGKSDKSARDVFFYYSGATPSAVRYKNWKMYYTMSQGARPAGSCRLFRTTLRWFRTSSAIHSSSTSSPARKNP
jgi:arylsulfatase A-like enzyme